MGVDQCHQPAAHPCRQGDVVQRYQFFPIDRPEIVERLAGAVMFANKLRGPDRHGAGP